MWLLATVGFASTVDMNRASASELDELPGIGPVKAQAIVQWRMEHGPCRVLDELGQVPGIGLATLGMLRGRAYCGGGEEATGGATGVQAAPAARPKTIDVNRATAAQLTDLPGVTEARARAIVAERDRGGAFTTCADLLRVPGIGPATVANLGSNCTPPAPPASEAGQDSTR